MVGEMPVIPRLPRGVFTVKTQFELLNIGLGQLTLMPIWLLTSIWNSIEKVYNIGR